jgi:transposase
VIIDLTAVRDGTGSARLLDMVKGRSKQAFAAWLAERPKPGATASRSLQWTGSPASRPPPPMSSPARSRVINPFHVVRLAGDALDRCRRRVQEALHGHRG